MNKEIAELWMKALRSGEHKQGKGVLRNTKDEYCCLGVLTDLIGDKSEWMKSKVGDWYQYGETRTAACLPFMVRRKAEMKSSFGLTRSSDNLVELNDRKGYTFLQIADFIEKHWEEL